MTSPSSHAVVREARRGAALLRAAVACVAVSLVLEPLTAAPNQNTVEGQVAITDRQGQAVANRANVVVFLEGALPGDTAAPHAVTPEIRQHGMVFTPRVLPIVKGQRVALVNDDHMFHNVFSLSRTAPFDLGAAPHGTTQHVTFERSGLVKIYCNIHPDMIGNILVLANHFFAVTDSEGRFRIDAVPDGEYTLRVWHEFSLEQQQPLRLAAGQGSSVTITLVETGRRVQHNNKFGKPYNEKY